MLLSPCIEWVLKAEHADFCDRIRAASSAGFKAVEFHMWRDKSLIDIERATADADVVITSFLVEPRVTLTDPAADPETLTAVRDSLPIAKRLKAPALVLASGPSIAGRGRQEQHDAMVSVLKKCACLAEETGVTLLVEPVNTSVDHPGVFLDLTPEGLDVIEEVGSPRVRLLYDMYHSTCMGESPEEVLGNRMHLVGHVQVADAPGRHEPGSGAIDWSHYMHVLRMKGYQGAIGLEYRPEGDSLHSLRRAREALGI